MATYNLDYLTHKNRKVYEPEMPVKLFSEKKLSVEVYKNGLVLPCLHDGKREGVFDSNRNFIARSSLSEVVTDKPDFPKGKINAKSKEAIYIGDLYSCFGHSLTDNLKKLWFLWTDECRKLIDNGAEIVYVAFNGENLKPHVFRIFELLGFDLRKAKEISEPTAFDCVYIPEDSIFIEEERRLYTKEYKRMVDSLIEKAHSLAEVPSYPKIYLSRTQLKDKEDYGEEKIEKLFRSKGYEIIYPEEHSLEEQICLLNQCEKMCATLGSVSHLSMFTPPIAI